MGESEGQKREGGIEGDREISAHEIVRLSQPASSVIWPVLRKEAPITIVL